MASSQVVISLLGSGFLKGARAFWNNEPRPTARVDGTRLTVTLQPTDLEVPGADSIVVANPDGKRSHALIFNVVFPNPQLTSVMPSRVSVWAPVTLTFAGSGIVPGSGLYLDGERVYVNGSTTHTSIITSFAPGELTPGLKRWTLRNPPPGGGESDPLDFVVEYGTPHLLSIVPAATAVGAAPLLTLRGSNFGPASRVLVNGVEHPASVLAWDVITTQLHAADLTTVGTLQVSVLNPAPGLESSPQTVRVDPTPPIVFSVFPSAVPAGSPATTLTVFGQFFLPSSQISWNNVGRPTRYVNSGRLETDLSASDLAIPTRADISILTAPPAPFPASVPFVVTGTPSRFRSKQVIRLDNNDIALDSVRGLLYVSTPLSVTGFSSAIVAFDLATGGIAWSRSLGNEPGVLAVSPGGRWLYALLKDKAAVARIDLTGPSLSTEIPLSVFGGPAQNILGIPGGNDKSILLAFPGLTVVFDDNVARPVQGAGVCCMVPSASPNRYYASDWQLLYWLDLDATGVTRVSSGFSWATGVNEIDQFNGRVFASSGSVVDAASLSLVGTLPAANSIRVDPVLARLYQIRDSTLLAYNAATLQPIDSLNLGFESGWSRRTLRFGVDGLVVHNDAFITILRSAVVAP